MKHVTRFVLLTTVIISAQACHRGHELKPAPGLLVSGRKKRSSTQATDFHWYYERNVTFYSHSEDADPSLSNFFANCMSRESGKIFKSWSSVVDFVLRDTYWFEATDKQFCGYSRDSVKCWQQRINSLIKSGSSLRADAKKCIREYETRIRRGGVLAIDKTREKRFILLPPNLKPLHGAFGTFGTGQIANQIPSASPEPPTKSSTTPIHPCPDFSPIDLAVCIKNNVDQVIQSDLIEQYPSLKNFDEASNQKFVTDHYSNCRIKIEKRRNAIAYVEDCGQNRGKRSVRFSEFFHNLLPVPTSAPAFTPCLINDLPQIVKPSSPTYKPIITCIDQYDTLNKSYASTPKPVKWSFTTKKPIIRPTTTTTAAPATAKPKLNKKKAFKGYCGKGDHWTKWYNTYTRDSHGDDENLAAIRTKYRGQVCEHPSAIEAKLAKPGRRRFINDVISITPNQGLLCLNLLQDDGLCEDYKVRFCCPYPKPLCPLGHQWTPWYNRDRPTTGGDYETLDSFVVEKNVCSNPVAVDARLRSLKDHYWKGFDVVDVSPAIGLKCSNSDQTNRICKDYEVRFCCPVPFYSFDFF